MSTESDVCRVGDLRLKALTSLMARFGLSLTLVDDGAAIPGTFWGEPEAGVEGDNVYVRLDTPLHSLLHEASHIICMDGTRRRSLVRDAGGDDLEEAAVCYLQVLLSDLVSGVGRDRLMRDMDTWGYSFRLGNTRAWFDGDADDARDWLVEHGITDPDGSILFRLRG